MPILEDMQILAVVTKTANDSGKGAFANKIMVSLAVTQEQALLLSLATHRGCHLQLLLRNPSKPIDPSYDIKKIIKLLQEDEPPQDDKPLRNDFKIVVIRRSFRSSGQQNEYPRSDNSPVGCPHSTRVNLSCGC